MFIGQQFLLIFFRFYYETRVEACGLNMGLPSVVVS